MPADVNEPLASVNMVEPTVTDLPPEVAAVGELLTDLISHGQPNDTAAQLATGCCAARGRRRGELDRERRPQAAAGE
ncbi:MAG TPA: hypothetical protein VK488_04130 [Gaiellaceae bacterium]|nr:hypothetical protein [Gaiellaceae bacterium]